MDSFRRHSVQWWMERVKIAEKLSLMNQEKKLQKKKVTMEVNDYSKTKGQ